MSRQLWIESFDWHRFVELLATEREHLAELLVAEIECQREQADPGSRFCEFVPDDPNQLETSIMGMIAADDWYSCFDKTCWPALDRLVWRSFSSTGFLGAELKTQPRTNGVLIDTMDAACRSSHSEAYRMGSRRFRCRETHVYPDETYDDPGYSIHDPGQVSTIVNELSNFDYLAYPDTEIQENFRDDFLLPMQYCNDHRLAIITRWS